MWPLDNKPFAISDPLGYTECIEILTWIHILQRVIILIINLVQYVNFFIFNKK